MFITGVACLRICCRSSDLQASVLSEDPTARPTVAALEALFRDLEEREVGEGRSTGGAGGGEGGAQGAPEEMYASVGGSPLESASDT